MFHQPNPPVKVGEWDIYISTKGPRRAYTDQQLERREDGSGSRKLVTKGNISKRGKSDIPRYAVFRDPETK